MRLCAFISPICLMMVFEIRILYGIIVSKSEVWPIFHCVGLGHGTMTLYVFLYAYYNSFPAVYWICFIHVFMFENLRKTGYGHSSHRRWTLSLWICLHCIVGSICIHQILAAVWVYECGENPGQQPLYFTFIISIPCRILYDVTKDAYISYQYIGA